MNVDKVTTGNTSKSMKEVFCKDTGRKLEKNIIDVEDKNQGDSTSTWFPNIVGKKDNSKDDHENLSQNVVNGETPEVFLTRDEIVLRRKLKVTARKKIKKLEKMQLSQKYTNEVVEKSEFSLQLVSEDFPTLNSAKMKKRNTYNHETLPDVDKESAEKLCVVADTKNIKSLEKSWKPKIKDPIHIDLNQALNHEKHKPSFKKSQATTQHNALSGNILDSDNPTRKKGKVRPDKVRKPSKLKSHILNERKNRLYETKENDICENANSSFETTEKQSCVVVVKGKQSAPISCELKDNALPNCEENILVDQHGAPTAFISNIHSRRFREYCTNCLTEEVISSVCALLEKVAYFQDRMYVREPIKASAKRRYVAGFNQVNKYLQVKKVKLLIIAPDLEKNPGEGGLDDRVQSFKMEAESQDIPCVFGPNRKRLGRAVKKNTLVSCVAVLSYEGAEELYAHVLKALQESKKKYLLLNGFHEKNARKKMEDELPKAENSYLSESGVTSLLLAKLREELLPTDRLMNAIEHCSLWTED